MRSNLGLTSWRETAPRVVRSKNNVYNERRVRTIFSLFHLGVVMKVVYHCWCDFCKEESEQDTPMKYCPNCGLGPPDVYLYVNKWNKRGQLVSTERR
jgi:hypothetical protein